MRCACVRSEVLRLEEPEQKVRMIGGSCQLRAKKMFPVLSPCLSNRGFSRKICLMSGGGFWPESAGTRNFAGCPISSSVSYATVLRQSRGMLALMICVVVTPLFWVNKDEEGNACDVMSGGEKACSGPCCGTAVCAFPPQETDQVPMTRPRSMKIRAASGRRRTSCTSCNLRI